MYRTTRGCKLTRLATIGYLSIVALLGFAASSQAATIDASPSTFAGAWNAAQAGDVIRLASGDYGDFNSNTQKPGIVTIRPQPGATPSMRLWTGARNVRFDGITLRGGYVNNARDFQVVNSRVTAYLRVDTQASISNAGILFDNDTFNGINLGPNAYEGRLSIRGYENASTVGVTVRNSNFGQGGCSDGIQIVGGANGVQVIGNTFDGLQQGSCAPHVDAIQLYGSRNTVIRGNLFRNSSTHIMAPDGGTNEAITDNVFVVSNYVPTVQLGSHNGSRFEHNTVRGVGVHMDSKTGGTASRNGVIRDNVFVGGYINTTNGSGCSACTVTNNLMSGAVFVGGSSPSTYAGHELASFSPGNNAATDGTDQGIRVTAAPSPTPTPTPTPSPSPTPTPAYHPACEPDCDAMISDLRAKLDAALAKIETALAALR